MCLRHYGPRNLDVIDLLLVPSPLFIFSYPVLVAVLACSFSGCHRCSWCVTRRPRFELRRVRAAGQEAVLRSNWRRLQRSIRHQHVHHS
jgi:hypothetical protein